MFSRAALFVNIQKQIKIVILMIFVILMVYVGISSIAERQIAAVDARGVAAIDQKLAAEADLLALTWVDTLHQIDHLHHLASLVTLARQTDAPRADRVLAQLQSAAVQAGPSILQASAIALDGRLLWSTLPMPAGRLALILPPM